MAAPREGPLSITLGAEQERVAESGPSGTLILVNVRLQSRHQLFDLGRHVEMKCTS